MLLAGGIDCLIQAALMFINLAKLLDEFKMHNRAEAMREKVEEIHSQIPEVEVFRPCTRCNPGRIGSKCWTNYSQNITPIWSLGISLSFFGTKRLPP
jgi:hypothetical protein